MKTDIQNTELYQSFKKALGINDLREDDNPYIVECCKIAEDYAKLRLSAVSGSVCPKCGCTDYEEWEELEYEKGGDDPMYGGALVPIKFTRCGECD